MRWETLRTNGNIGAPYACPKYPIRSVQVLGTFGGATVIIEGSNMVDDPTYSILNDDLGVPIEIGETEICQIKENTYWVRPRISGGDSTTDLDVYLLLATER